MFAVILSGGKQYRVSEGDTIKIEKLETSEGATVEFDKVLLIADEDGANFQIGTPYLEDKKVSAEVLQQGRGDKVKIVKFRRRKHHMKQAGHRQDFTKVKITKISS